MNHKILIATEKPFAKESATAIRDLAEKLNVNVQFLEKYSSKDELIEQLQDKDALIVRSDIIDANIIAAAPNLKTIVRAGAGYDNIDLEAATQQSVCVMNTPGQNSNAVAELSLGLMIYSSRDFFQGGSGTELKGKTLAVHGFGNIGKRLARMAQGMGMDTIAYCFIGDIPERDWMTYVDEVKDLFEQGDFVSINIPLTPQTKGSVNKELLGLCKNHVTLINTARKEVMNENDLVAFLTSNPKAKYLSDIQPANIELFKPVISQCFFTPKKMGAQTMEANTNAGVAALQQIVDFFSSGTTKFQVNK